MSDNINHAEYIGDGRLHIRRGDAVGLLVVYEDDLAEGNWLEEFDLEGHLTGDMDEMLLIEPFWWYGQSSDSRFDTLVDHLLPATTGHAQILFIHDSGGLAGLEVNDGVVTEKTVKATLT